MYIGGTLSFLSGQTIPDQKIELTYDFLLGLSDSTNLAKRILTEVQHKTDNLTSSPSTLFSYYGQSTADSVSVGNNDFSSIFNADTGALYGAMKTVTTPSGMTKTYTYKQQEIDVSRHLELDSAITSHRHILFSDNYSLLLGNNSDHDFTIEVLEWTPRGWEMTYTKTHNFSVDDHGLGSVHVGYDPYKLVSMQPNYFTYATLRHTSSNSYRNHQTHPVSYTHLRAHRPY